MEAAALKSRRVTLIEGYLAGVDARAWGLSLGNDHRRLGLIINQFYPEIPGGFFFDHELAVEIARVLGSFGDGVLVRFAPKAFGDLGRAVARHHVPSWAPRQPLLLYDIATLSRIYDDVFEADDHDDPSENVSFDEMRVTSGRSTIVEVRAVDCHQFGGPEPYHDQLLWNVYVAPSLAAPFARKLSEMATRCGVTMSYLRGATDE